MKTILTSSLFRFLLVGMLNTAVGLSVMLVLLHGAKLDYWMSTLIGTAVGACVSYVLNRSFTFKSRTAHKTGLIKFLLVLGSCYVVAYASSSWLTGSIGEFIPVLSGDAGRTIAVVLGNGLYTILNYLGQKHFVFAERDRA
ncbi:GtrA family protein [Paenibacillus puerhi]|uniref:GtrA family protein n=1 Tax=Paenibacillus puerhi TaxID=2692622 RepID=UPI00135A86DB|nr:GtrA family protein [Paenibacillus puerhi]